MCLQRHIFRPQVSACADETKRSKRKQLIFNIKHNEKFSKHNRESNHINRSNRSSINGLTFVHPHRNVTRVRMVSVVVRRIRRCYDVVRQCGHLYPNTTSVERG